MKSLIILSISLLDTTVTIDSHNWHFITNYMLTLCKNIEQGYSNRDGLDIVLNVIDALI